MHEHNPTKQTQLNIILAVIHLALTKFDRYFSRTICNRWLPSWWYLFRQPFIREHLSLWHFSWWYLSYTEITNLCIFKSISYAIKVMHKQHISSYDNSSQTKEHLGLKRASMLFPYMHFQTTWCLANKIT